MTLCGVVVGIIGTADIGAFPDARENPVQMNPHIVVIGYRFRVGNDRLKRRLYKSISAFLAARQCPGIAPKIGKMRFQAFS